MDQLTELVGFLENSSPDIQKVALQNLLPYSAANKSKQYLFTNHDLQGVKAIRNIVLRTNDPETRKAALTALVNLSDNNEVRSFLASTPSDLTHYVTKITSKTEPHSGLYCMLMANLAHDKGFDSLIGSNLDLLIFALVSSGPMTSFDYLGFVFGQIATRPPGVKYLSHGKLEKLYLQLHSPSLTRRSGVAAAVKNVLFDLDAHPLLVKTSLVENIMITLKGPEALDEEDSAKLPEMVRRLVSPQKRREPDSGLQLVLVECLLLLSLSAIGRANLRDTSSYFVVRELHLATDNEQLKEACERFVNQVMRGEPEEADEAQIHEVTDDPEDGEDDEVVEVV